ncbi:flagellar basal body-associated FliL family protein [Mahella sp.]|uniref:flagellar basal body-associated FliL family protein n=1 Tax=Mahella sp. TaxID=2798721 RepID=UPI0025BE7DAF|nr:flagellar basal body-associated FliL family protein [Mahella sp.]MBZ4666230.1 flagellar basal body-associated protein FliL [Mahella sp.]
MTKNNKLLLWITMIVVLAAAALIAYYMTSSSNANGQDITANKTEIFMPTVKDGSFVTNLKDSRHFLKVTMVIEVANGAILDEFTSKDYMVNDIIVSVLSNKTDEEAAADGFQSKLKNEIISALNKKFGEGAVVNIYFNEFVIQ